MAWIELIIGGLVGLAASISLIAFILQASQRYGLAVRASEPHHTHAIPVPRLGGIALAGAMVTVVLVFSCCLGTDFFLKNDRWLVIPSSLAMFGLGLWDDFRALGAKRKLFGQLLIASATYFCGIGIYHFRIPFMDQVIDLGLWSWPVTVLWLVAMTNLINLIDGVDGLAGGICLMLMVLMMYVSTQAGLMPIITAGMIGALLGFLRFNFPPARIYMGDGGAYFLGFFIGCTTIVTSQKGTIFAALVAPLFVLALPIIDTTLAILRRGIRGLPLFRPDRKHIHHRLLASGHSRRNVVLGLYGFTAFFLLLGFAAFSKHGQYLPLMLGVGALTVLLAAGKFDFSREWFSIGRVLGNSLETRAVIQYAMSLSRWLALEGTRAQTLENIADDVVFIARKLGFSSVRIRLEDEEKHWKLTAINSDQAKNFRHELPGHKYCFLELGAACPGCKKTPATEVCKKCEATFQILADLLAEGWIKAVADWKRTHQLPVRFDARLKEPSALDKTPKS
jgi:UDP-GlcNAc:undecaprenyl-phosphate GlcNAc-1-phosphate transferase